MNSKVLYVFSRSSRAEQQRLVANVESPDDLLYGYLKIDDSKWEAEYICRYQDEWNWVRRIWFPVEWVIARLIKMGLAWSTVWDNRQKLAKADVIVATADVVGLPLAWFKHRGWLKPPLFYISQGLTDRLEALPVNSWRRRLFVGIYGSWLRAADEILVLGEGAKEPLIKLLSLKHQRVAVVPFGVDDNFWQPARASSTPGDVSATPGVFPALASVNYILSVGSDMARDYETLLRAIGDKNLKIVTRQNLPAEMLGDNIKVSSRHTDEELRELYQRASLVVIPLKNVAQPSGQSATLQAMACGKAVILTNTRGLWEPEVMQHKVNCYLVEPEDVEDLQKAIEWMQQNPVEARRIGKEARRTIEERYNSRQLARAIEQQINVAI